MIWIFITIVNFVALLPLVLSFKGSTHLDSRLILSTLIFTLVQALLSALFSILVGVLLAPGYARLGRLQNQITLVLLVPQLMSPILAVLSLLVSFEHYPFGLLGIVLGHTFINFGLSTVWMGSAWKEIEDKWCPVTQALGASSFQTLRKVFLPQLVRPCLNTFAVVFSFCTSSFAIPLVLGGGPQNSTLEVLAYEALKASGDLKAAVLVSVLQVLTQLVIFLLILRSWPKERGYFHQRSEYFTKPFSFPVIITFICAVFSLFPFAKTFFSSFSLNYFSTLVKIPLFMESIWNSLAVALFVGLLTFLTLIYLSSLELKSSFLKMPTLSGVVLGLGIFSYFGSLGPSTRFQFLLALFFGHFCTTFFSVLRLTSQPLFFWQQKLSSTLRLMGISPIGTLKTIYFPLNYKIAAAAAVLAGVWSMGEFSVSRVLSGENLTLPVFISNLLSSYRLELAGSAAIILIGTVFLTLFVFKVLADGVR